MYNSPLYIVDGIEREFDDIDFNDIETVTVLKDMAATTLYGVGAKNGAIIVTTKRGTNNKFKVSASGVWGVKEPTVDYDYYMPYHKNLEYYNEALINDGRYEYLIPQSEINAWKDPNRDKDYFSYTNWMPYLVSTGPTHAYNVNVSGGGKVVKFYTSIGYNYDGDIFNIEEQEEFDPRTYQKRFNIRANLDFTISKTTHLKLNFSNIVKNWNGNGLTYSDSNYGYGNLEGLFKYHQVYTPPVLSNGQLGMGNSATGWYGDNYYAVMERMYSYSTESNDAYIDLVFSQQFLKYFEFNAKLSHSASSYYRKLTRKTPLYYTSNPYTNTIRQVGDPDAVEQPIERFDSELIDYNNDSYYEASLRFNKEIGHHNVEALALHRKWDYESKRASVIESEKSWVARATYNYKQKYFVELNGSNNRYDYMPSFDMDDKAASSSLGIGWIVSEEDFFKNNISFINLFKLRYSNGKVAIDNKPKIDSPPSGETDDLSFDNEKDKEISRKQNLGIDMAFLNKALSFNLDFYKQKNEGILMQAHSSIPSWVGSQRNYMYNLGESKMHGVDLSVAYNKSINDNWQINVGGYLSFTENRIVSRDDLPDMPDYRKSAGKPIGWSSGFYNDRLLSNTDDMFNYPMLAFGLRGPGDFTYIDYNADGVIDYGDKAPFAGTYAPNKTYAFNVGLKYKNISASALFSGVYDIYRELSDYYLWETSVNGGHGFRMLNTTEMLDRWTPENPNAEHPALHSYSNRNNEQKSTYTLRRSDFLRLKTLELKYILKGQNISVLPSDLNLELFFIGNNLFTWSKLPEHIDPEPQTMEVYPITKRYSLGFRLAF